MNSITNTHFMIVEYTFSTNMKHKIKGIPFQICEIINNQCHQLHSTIKNYKT